jgi:hypothetical protein
VTDFVETAAGDVKAKFFRAVLGGFTATVLLTLMMYFAAPMMTGRPMDIAAHLGAMMGGSWTAGMVGHFVLGTVLFPLGYLFVTYRSMPEPAWLKGVVWGLILWLAAMIVVMPLTGGGFFMGAMSPAMASLVGHMVYGAVLGAIVGLPGRP